MNTQQSELYDKGYFTEISLKNSGVFKAYIDFLEQLNIKLSNINLLDIGCGKGEFFSLLSNEGCNLVGTDISEYAVEQARSTFKSAKFFLEDLNNNLNDEMHLEGYNVITMFDVIEHLYNFEHLKMLINTKLKKGGYFIITTPNANSLLRFILGKQNYTGEYDETHRILFTPYTLDFFLRKSGLEKVSLSTPYSFYFRNNWLTKKVLFGGQILAVYIKK